MESLAIIINNVNKRDTDIPGLRHSIGNTNSFRQCQTISINKIAVCFSTFQNVTFFNLHFLLLLLHNIFNEDN